MRVSFINHFNRTSFIKPYHITIPMCGRFSLTTTEKELLMDIFGLKSIPFGLKPRYNIAPSQDVSVVRNDESDRLSLARWGLIPSWAKDKAIGYKMINARAETVREKPAFRSSFKNRRCLVIADSFYEWKHDSRKIPYRVLLKSKKPFAFAGLWDRWERDGEKIISCTIITTKPNSIVRKIHDRMPAILQDPRAWLDADETAAYDMLKPYEDEKMTAYQVSDKINSPANESPEVIMPVQTLADF